MARWIIIALLFFPNIALGGVYVSGGVAPVEIGRRIAVSSPGVITLASGSVTHANTKISAADGTAFVDFSTADVLTDYVPYKGKLTITDSTGKKLTGYIKAAGTGETYGSELVTNGDMEFDDANWSNDGTPTTNERSTAQVQSGTYSRKIISDAPLEGIRQSSIPFTIGRLYQRSGWFYPTALTTNWRLNIFDGNGTTQDNRTFTLVANTWNKIELYYTSVVTGNSGIIRALSNAAETFYVDSITLKQVLTPSTTGVTITSTPNGTTYNWASQESGFNYNDASGYTYAITTR